VPINLLRAEVATVYHVTEVQTKQTAIIETGVEILPTGSWDDPTTSYGKVICLAESLKNLDKQKKGKSFVIDKKEWRRRVTAAASHYGFEVRTQLIKKGDLKGKLRIIKK
jgi:hypothetical protein